jgi:WD40 repeat protein
VIDHESNTLYTLVTRGTHGYEGSTRNGSFVPRHGEVVAIDLATFEERSRLELAILDASNPEVQGTDIALSPDGSMIAATVRGEAGGSVHLVDVASWSEVDSDAVTAGTQPIDVSATVNPRAVVFSNDGTKAYVSRNDDGTVEVVEIDVATFATTDIDVPSISYVHVYKGPGDLVYIAAADTNSGYYTYDPSGPTLTPSTYSGTPVSAMVFGPNGNMFIKGGAQTAAYHEIDPSNGSVVTSFTGTNGHYGHSIAITPFE